MSRVPIGLDEMVQISPYTIWQMAEIVKEEIEEMGVELENTKEVDEAIFQSIEKNEVLTAKEAVRLAGKMVREAEVLQFIPVLTAEGIKKTFDLAKERKEVR